MLPPSLIFFIAAAGTIKLDAGWQKVGDTGDKVPRTYRLEPGPIDLRERKRGEEKKGGKRERGEKSRERKKKRKRK
jgi:hypothetical protein